MRESQHQQYLGVMMLGNDNSEILKTVAHLIASHNCRLVNCHIILQGGNYQFNFLLEGSWSALAKIEPKLAALEHKYELKVFFKRIEFHPSDKPSLPYVLYIVSAEDPQVFDQLMRFLSHQPVVITEIFTESYKTRQTHTPMLTITVKIRLSAEVSISDWRERFMLFCDDMNFDAIMEPEKP